MHPPSMSAEVRARGEQRLATRLLRGALGLDCADARQPEPRQPKPRQPDAGRPGGLPGGLPHGLSPAPRLRRGRLQGRHRLCEGEPDRPGTVGGVPADWQLHAVPRLRCGAPARLRPADPPPTKPTARGEAACRRGDRMGSGASCHSARLRSARPLSAAKSWRSSWQRAVDGRRRVEGSARDVHMAGDGARLAAAERGRLATGIRWARGEQEDERAAVTSGGNEQRGVADGGRVLGGRSGRALSGRAPQDRPPAR